MRNLCHAILLLAAAVIAGAPSASETPAAAETIAPAQDISIPNSYHRSLTSKLNGITYDLSVFLPKNYDPKSGHRFPVFYMIPGRAFGVYMSQVVRFLAAGDIPRVIIVGVDFPPGDSYSMDLPTSGKDPHWNVPDNRGALNFLNILTNEIKPSIDREFPTNPDDTGLGGHSMGGFFALYAMLHRPDVYHRIYASSPSFVWQNFVLLRDEADLAKRANDLPVRAFVDQGADEENDGRLAALDAAIRSRKYPSLHWHAQRTVRQSHETIALADGIDALYFLYGPDLRQASTTELGDLSGNWKASDGRTFHIHSEKGRAYLDNFFPGEAPSSVELLSSEPGKWFLRYLWYTFDIVHSDHGTPTLEIHLEDTPGPNGKTKTPELTAQKTPPS